MSKYWYAYTGAPGSENIPGNYLAVPSNPDLWCPGGTKLCAIYSTGGSIPTTITDTILNYFVLASCRQHKYPDGLGQEPFVWTEP